MGYQGLWVLRMSLCPKTSSFKFVTKTKYVISGIIEYGLSELWFKRALTVNQRIQLKSCGVEEFNKC